MKKVIRKIINWAFDIEDSYCVADIHRRQPSDFILIKRRKDGQIEVFTGGKNTQSKHEFLHDIKAICEQHHVPPKNVLVDAPREFFM